jgi:phage baseplate assembly protein W
MAINKREQSKEPESGVSHGYLKLPLRRERLRFETVEIEESIREFIGLIMTTRPGNFSFNSDFGCRIWEKEFQYIKGGRFKEEIHKAVHEAVETFEPRLKSVGVDVTIKGFGDTSSEKRVVEIWVRGIIKVTGRTFEERFDINWDRGRKNTST